MHEYVDDAVGIMVAEPNGKARFTEVVLRPRIVVGAQDQVPQATALHDKAHEMCFIARSVNFPVTVRPQITAR